MRCFISAIMGLITLFYLINIQNSNAQVQTNINSTCNLLDGSDSTSSVQAFSKWQYCINRKELLEKRSGIVKENYEYLKSLISSLDNVKDLVEKSKSEKAIDDLFDRLVSSFSLDQSDSTDERELAADALLEISYPQIQWGERYFRSFTRFFGFGVSRFSNTSENIKDKYLEFIEYMKEKSGNKSLNIFQKITNYNNYIAGENKKILELSSNVGNCDLLIKFSNREKFNSIDQLVNNAPISEILENCRESYKSILSENAINDVSDRAAALVDEGLPMLRNIELLVKEEIDNINTELLELEKFIENFDPAKIDANIQSSRAETIIDQTALDVIKLTLIAWTMIVLFVVIAILMLNWQRIKYLTSFQSNSKNREIKEDFNYVLFLEMITVFILTVTILILGIAGKLQTEGLAALIGGISGYVLGRMHGKAEKQTSE